MYSKKEMISKVKENFDFLAFDDDIITSDRVQDGLKEITERSEKAKQSANKRWKRSH